MFDYTRCEIEVDSLERLKEEFEDVYRNIRGRTEGYGDVTQDTANRFTDLIAEPIRNLAVENQEAWGGAMMACIVAIGAVSETIKAVEWYEEKIEEIRERYEAKLRNSDVEGRGAIETLAEPYNNEASDAWDELERMCDEAGQSLEDGDSPENIQALIEAGHIGADIPFAITGDWEMYYFDPDDAESTINTIEQAAEEGGAGYIAAITAAGGHLGALSELVRRSIEAQKNGDNLNENELEFLEQMFGEFEGEENQDFLEFVDTIENSEHLEDSLIVELKESLSGSVLATSDERIGGQYQNVPEDVRQIVQGPRTPAPSSPYGNWTEEFRELSKFFSHADQNIQGGTDFSAELTGTISRALYNENFGDPSTQGIPDSELQTMLDISTRNVDANYAVITGEYPDGGPDFQFGELNREAGVDLDLIIQGLYAHDWQDDGEAAAQLTDWIYDYKTEGTSVEQELATHASFELISSLTDEDVQESIRNTGITTDGGNRDASFTEINNHIAGSMNNLYIANINDFSMTSVDERNEDWGVISEEDLRRNPLHERGDFAMSLSDETRRDFMQFLLANDDLSPNVLAASHAHEMEFMNAAITGGGDVRSLSTGEPGWDANSLGARAGFFNNLLNEAMVSEFTDRGATQDEAREQYANNWLTAYELVKIGSSDVTGGPANTLSSIIFQSVDDPVKSGVERLSEHQISDDFLEQGFTDSMHQNEAELHNNVLLQALNVSLEEGLMNPDDIPDELAPRGGGAVLPQVSNDWEEGARANSAAMRKLLEDLNIEVEGDDGDLLNITNEYSDGYTGEHQGPADLLIPEDDDIFTGNDED